MPQIAQALSQDLAEPVRPSDLFTAATRFPDLFEPRGQIQLVMSYGQNSRNLLEVRSRLFGAAYHSSRSMACSQSGSYRCNHP